jgi:phosphoenolpyruvate-protein kinase (PTS system EI component)
MQPKSPGVKKEGSATPELDALLDVHLMPLQDEMLAGGVKHWITERHYNAEWRCTTQYRNHRAPVLYRHGRWYLREARPTWSRWSSAFA